MIAGNNLQSPAVSQSFDRKSNHAIREKLNKRIQDRKAKINQNKNEIEQISAKLERLQREAKKSKRSKTNRA